MTSPREILEARLAKGEISEEEFDRLASRLSGPEPDPAPEPTPPPAPPSQPSTLTSAPAVQQSFWDTGLGKVAKFAGGAFIVLVVIGMFSGGGAKDLSVGNIVGSGTRLEFKLANSGNSRGDVVFWVEQNGIEKCNHIFRVAANKRYNMRVTCRNLRPGDFSLRYAWASGQKKRASISQRVNSR